LSYMLLDADEVATSPSTVYRILERAGKLNRQAKTESKTEDGLQQSVGSMNTGTWRTSTSARRSTT
jgi:hypothetical protein